MPDEPRPSATAARDALVATLHALCAEWADGPPVGWENVTVPDYLAAMAAWLQDCEGYYLNQHLPFPDDGWEVVQAAVRAAKVYE